MQLLDAESSQSIAAWASSTVLALAGVALGLLGIIRRPIAWSLVIAAAALALLSADDDIGIFDQVLRDRLPSHPDPGLVIWIIGFGPLMGLTAVVLARLAQHSPREFAPPIWWGLGLLVAAVALELIVTLIPIPALLPGQPLYELEATLEEGFELLGVALIAAAGFGMVIDEVVRGRPTP